MRKGCTVRNVGLVKGCVAILTVIQETRVCVLSQTKMSILFTPTKMIITTIMSKQF